MKAFIYAGKLLIAASMKVAFLLLASDAAPTRGARNG